MVLMMPKRIQDVFKGFSYLLLIYLIILCLCQAWTSVPSFDGAMNAQVARNLLEHGRYATDYGWLQDFNKNIQTGWPLLGLLTILYYFLGVTAFASMLAGSIYLIAFGVLIFFIFKKLSNHFYITLSLILIILTPSFWKYGNGLNGEIATLFWALLAATLLYQGTQSGSRKFYVLSGLSLSLALMTKTVILIFIAPLFLLLFLDLLFYKKIASKNILILFIAGISPLLCFEIYKFIVFDSVTDYLNWWSPQLHAILNQAGVSTKLPDTADRWAKMIEHIGIFAKLINLPIPFTYFFLGLFPFAAGLYLKERVTPGKITARDYFFILIIVTTLAYFIWWIFITPTARAWPRRILDGLILLLLSYVFLLSFFLTKAFFEKNLIASFVPFSIFVALSGYTTFNFNYLPLPSFNKSAHLLEVEAITGFINQSSPSAEFNGFGWWQAPVVSLLSRPFGDLFKKNYQLDHYFKDEVYLVIDKYLYQARPDRVSWLLNQLDTQLVRQSGEHFLYKVNAILPGLSQFRPTLEILDFNPKHIRRKRLDDREQWVTFQLSEHSAATVVIANDFIVPTIVNEKGALADFTGFETSSDEIKIRVADPLLKTVSEIVILKHGVKSQKKSDK